MDVKCISNWSLAIDTCPPAMSTFSEESMRMRDGLTFDFLNIELPADILPACPIMKDPRRLIRMAIYL